MFSPWGVEMSGLYLGKKLGVSRGRVFTQRGRISETTVYADEL